MQRETVLVTGATGFLGEYLVRRLVGSYRVLALGRNAEKGRGLEAMGAVFCPGDFTDRGACAGYFRGVQYVIHAGALSTVWGRWEDFLRTNVLGTAVVARLCQENGVRRLVYVSSPSIYTEKQDRYDIREDQAPAHNELNFYIKSKLMAEREIGRWAAKGLETVILRPRGLIGVGDTSLVPRLLRANARIGIPLFRDGANLVDLTSVENVAQACELAMKAEGAAGEVFNITNGEPAAFRSLLEQFLAAIGERPRYRRLPFGMVCAGAAALERIYSGLGLAGEPPLTRYTVCTLGFAQTMDISRAREILGYAPEKTLAQSIREYGEWWRKQGRAGKAESRAGKAESQAGNAESQAGNVESRAGKAESRAGSAESRAGKAESRAGNVESRAGKAETRAGSAESRAGKAESQAESAESRAGKAESQAESAESRAGKAESQAGKAESQAGNAETRAAKTGNGLERAGCGAEFSLQNTARTGSRITQVSLYHCGSCTNNLGILFRGRSWEKREFPAAAALIRHRYFGNILYDTGYSGEIFKGGFFLKLYRLLNPVRLEAGQTISEQLEKHGVSPERVKTIILSHAHPDHIGGLSQFSGYELVATEEVLDTLRRPRLRNLVFENLVPGAETDWTGRAPGKRLTGHFLCRYFERVYDLMGDESIIGVVLEGHSRGQMGIWIPDVRLFLAADACWGGDLVRSTLQMRLIPRLIQKDFAAYKLTLQKLCKLKRDYPDIQIVFTHQSGKERDYG